MARVPLSGSRIPGSEPEVGIHEHTFYWEKQGMAVERAENECPIRAGSALPGPVQGKLVL